MWGKLNTLCWNRKMKALRGAEDWTQVEAAEKCSTSQKMYSRWETGANYPRKYNQIFIARAFKVKVDDIFPSKA